MNTPKLVFIGAILVGLIAGLTVSQVYNVMAKDKDEESPWDAIWAAIEDLQSSADSLGSRIDAIEDGYLPEVITVTGHPREEGWHELTSAGQYTDLLSIPDVAVAEHSKVLAIASAYFYSPTAHPYTMNLTHRANMNFGELGGRYQGWGTPEQREIIEIHHAWSDLEAGTYTFAITYFLRVDSVYVANSRLTLIIF